MEAQNYRRFTELRGEFLNGQQTATANSSETPNALVAQLGKDGFYTRSFRGAYFYLLHNIFSAKHQLLIKYDIYDPNTKVRGNDIGVAGAGFSAADIKYSTLGLGYLYHINPNVKWVFYYAVVKNEKTQLPGFTSDIQDNVFTSRLQFRF